MIKIACHELVDKRYSPAKHYRMILILVDASLQSILGEQVAPFSEYTLPLPIPNDIAIDLFPLDKEEEGVVWIPGELILTHEGLSRG